VEAVDDVERAAADLELAEPVCEEEPQPATASAPAVRTARMIALGRVICRASSRVSRAFAPNAVTIGRARSERNDGPPRRRHAYASSVAPDTGRFVRSLRVNIL
jgi:hypothetical protein